VSRVLTFTQAVNEALALAMERDPGVITFGLGVGDPKNIFGTTAGLQERFGAARVFDMPAAENAMTGVAIGAALHGVRPVMVHQRMDFFLLALDQLVNTGAKWHYMFGGRRGVPLTIRLILGRGWGQGPTHSQALHAWLAHVPGLKVALPSTPRDAKGLLLAAIFDDNPVVIIEHRWLHQATGEVPEGDHRVALGTAQVVREGADLTVAALSYMVPEALRAAAVLERQGCGVEVVDVRSVAPLDWGTILGAVRRTGRLLALDIAPATLSVAGEIVARAAMEAFGSLRCAPRRIALPDLPTPTSPALTRGFYPGAAEVVRAAGEMLGRRFDASELETPGPPHDVPGAWFKGPF
jgi:pyruvate dehydrogenase E1 component beta subunit